VAREGDIVSESNETPRVLIVDDSLTVRMDLNDAFAAAGFTAVAAGSLAEARGALAQQRFALVLLDVLLPDGDGLEFLQELKADPASASLPVLVLSTEAEVRDRVRALHTGADDYVGKPYEIGYVLGRARELIDRRAAASTNSGDALVLLIDDSVSVREALSNVLQTAGYQVATASSGEEGLRLAAARRPDVVVVDGMLPGGIDGTTVVRRLKLDVALRHTPCLMLTGSAQRDDELQALEAGADAFLRKSADSAEILLRLGTLLRSAPPRGSSSGGGFSLSGPKRILAVDDSPTYLNSLADELRGEGYEVVKARSGQEALDLLAAQTVDCILLDLVMPGLSGHEACRRIKSDVRWRDIPLMVLTALEERDAMIEGLAAGADDYITKSGEFAVLKARLRAQLRRRQVEEESRRAREDLVRAAADARFNQLLHSSIIGVILGQRAGAFLDANDAFLNLVDLPRAAITEGVVSLADVTPPEERAGLADLMRDLWVSDSIGPLQRHCLRRDGTRVPVVLGFNRIEQSDTFVGFVVDRTESKQAEEKLRNYAAALEAANHALEAAKERAERESMFKSKFLANMSHELRTPLNAIIGFSELLQQSYAGELSGGQREYVGYVQQSGQHLLTLINEVLDISKVEAGRIELQRETVSLRSLVDAVHGVVRSLADGRNVALEVDLPPDLPEISVDPVRVKQVLYNLLSNGIKFTPGGGRVGLTAHRDGPRLVLQVEDSGVGIRAEDMPRLFREFERLEPASGERPEGTGLGLALSKRLVELHAGTISARSELGKGSVFEVVLPLVAPDGTHEVLPASTGASASGAKS
jgi:PAS domain S-box-containing protein